MIDTSSYLANEPHLPPMYDLFKSGDVRPGHRSTCNRAEGVVMELFLSIQGHLHIVTERVTVLNMHELSQSLALFGLNAVHGVVHMVEL